MKHCRLIYRSTAVAEIVSNETIRDLADRSANANQARHISGLLLLSGNRFLQVLEGPHGEVNRLFGKIIRDTRHRDVELMSFEPMESAYFDAWHMRLVDLHDLPKQPREFIAAKYPNRQGVIEIPERLHYVWQHGECLQPLLSAIPHARHERNVRDGASSRHVSD